MLRMPLRDLAVRYVCVFCLAGAALEVAGAPAAGATPDNPFAMAYYPSLHELEVRVKKAAKAADEMDEAAQVRVKRVDGEQIVAEGTLSLGEKGQGMLHLPELSEGIYEVQCSLPEQPHAKAPDKEPAGGAGVSAASSMAGTTNVLRFKHKNFPWLGNSLGASHEIFPPFQPVTVDDNRVRVVLREYAMNGFGLWDSVLSEGTEILAAPITLHLWTTDGEARWSFSDGHWQSRADDAVVYRSGAVSGPLRIESSSTIEFDGCMKVAMVLSPGGSPAEIQRLSLEVPVKASEARLFHYCAFESMRRNYAGETPRGGQIRWGPKPEAWLPPRWTAEPGADDGVLWTCRDIRPWSHVIATDFVPYIWLGGAERGVAFFGENDQGYLVDPKGVVQRVERRGDRVVIRVDLINRPSVVTEPRRVVFGLQASPTRPMPSHWRQEQGVPPHAGPVVCWGGYICADKFPDGHNFAIVDAIQEARRTGIVDERVFEQFDRDRAEPWKHPWADARNSWLDGNFRYFLQSARRAFAPAGPDGKPYPYTTDRRFLNFASETYFEEHASDVTTEEWEVYQDEWRAKWPWPKRDKIAGEMQPVNNYGRGQQNFPASYRDFCLYYANEWMKRGVGLYFDNTMPYTAYNPTTSEAYLDSEGRVQPACPIWEQREYYKRIWTRMMELVRSGVPRFPLAYTQHITNTRILPLNTWCDASLDMEWEWYGSDAVRTPDGARVSPYPYELLLAETAGRQTGTIPHALAGVTGMGRESKALSPDLARCEWGMRTVHEIAPLFPFASFESFKSLERLKQAFGYGSPQCEVFNYWNDQPAVRVSDTKTKWLLLSHPDGKALLLILQSWNRDETRTQVTLADGPLGFHPSSRVTDAETGEALPVEPGGALRFRIALAAPYGTRVVRVGWEN